MADVALELESFFEDAIAFRREWIRAFDENRERRETAEVELHEARAELEGLLTTSRARGLKVATLARQAGVSRETAHKLLRRACE